jgi:hypothetical protein
MKKNYRRIKDKKWKPRIPIPKPDRAIEPDTIYNRHKVKEKVNKYLKEFI